MLTSTVIRLFRLLLSLVLRIRPSLRRIALVLRARFASLWGSILALAPRSGRSQVRLNANDVPVIDNRPQPSEPAKVEEEASGTLATLPVQRGFRWQDELSRYWQDSTSSNHSSSQAIPAIPANTSQRYKRRKVIGESPKSLYIPAGQDTLVHALQPLPDGWIRHIHPEGCILFYHQKLRIFTESDIISREKEILLYATGLIQQAIETDGVTMDELTEIVLNVDDDQRWHYYFVDHKNRLLFWVHRINSAMNLGVNLQEVTGHSHIKYFVEAQYWYASSDSVSGMCVVYDMDTRSHCEFYPHNRVLPRGVFKTLRGMMNYAKTDMMTTDLSTSPFTLDELAAISDLISSLNDNENDKISDSYSIWVIARLMSLFTENQFMNFCGQQCARLNADTPLFGQETWNRGHVFQLVNVFLLGLLNEHAVRLQRLWVDNIIIQPRLKNFINRLTNELSRYTLISTVMLAVDLSFLAVPGVVPTNPPASPIEIFIYCSVVSTVGSIICSFALMNVYSNPGMLNANTVADVMKRFSQTKSGMACLAITHCLPIACLVWSIVLFTVALALRIFLPKELPTVVALGVTWGIILLFVVVSFVVMLLYSGNDRAGDVAASPKDDPVTGGNDVEQGHQR